MMNPNSSHWVKCISTQGHIRGVAVEATALVQELAERHRIKGVAIQGLGESVVGALLVASYCKAGQHINLNIQGEGRFKQALVDAYPDGKVRGYVIERTGEVDMPPHLGPWGTGFLSVLRTRDEEGEKPYIGTVPLLTGHLAKDLSFYWVQSEQIPSAVGLSIQLDGDRVKSAAGFLVQALPGAKSQEVNEIEHHIHEIQSLALTMGDGYEGPMRLLTQIFQDTAFVVVEEKSVEFHCTCSWERVSRALMLIGTAELEAMLKEEDATVVICDFCSKEYSVDKSTLEDLISKGN